MQDLPIFLVGVRRISVVVSTVRICFHPFGVRRQRRHTFWAHRTDGAVRVAATRVTVLNHGRGIYRIVVARHWAAGGVHHPHRVHTTYIWYEAKQITNWICLLMVFWVLTIRTHRRIHELQVVIVQYRRQKSVWRRGHFVIVIL